MTGKQVHPSIEPWTLLEALDPRAIDNIQQSCLRACTTPQEALQPNIIHTEPSAHVEKTLCTVGQNNVEGNIPWQIFWHIIAINTDYVARQQLIAQITNKGIIEQNVYICSKHETSSCAPDSNVLSNHLE